ncbi:MAG: hypothetical protein HN380_30330, partial [Victivallales bacterium]|nr:hypothetical protein [Victivallales bacterium]
MHRGSTLSFLILAALTVSIPRSLAMPHPGSNTDPKPGPVAKPPYEMEGRAEAHPPIAHFTDCTAWTVKTTDAEANLYRTQEQRLF